MKSGTSFLDLSNSRRRDYTSSKTCDWNDVQWTKSDDPQIVPSFGHEFMVGHRNHSGLFFHFLLWEEGEGVK